jgi:hypothetical protein
MVAPVKKVGYIGRVGCFGPDQNLEDLKVLPKPSKLF